MADKVVSDLLMKFVDWEGNTIIGEALTQIPKDRSDRMWKGFEKDHMQELTKFSFKTGLGSEEGDATSRNAKKETENQKRAAQNKEQEDYKQKCADVEKTNAIRKKNGQEPDPLPTPPKFKTSKASLGFKAFRESKDPDKARYPVDLKPVELSRLADRSSPIFLDHCINRRVFRSATIIKRKAAGGSASGEIFLRMDFHHVLLKSVEWSNDTPIQEEIEFICRGVTLNYKPQLPDGSLGAKIGVFWKSPLQTEIIREDLKGY